jgi:hypothetical protein
MKTRSKEETLQMLATLHAMLGLENDFVLLIRSTNGDSCAYSSLNMENMITMATEFITLCHEQSPAEISNFQRSDVDGHSSHKGHA